MTSPDGRILWQYSAAGTIVSAPVFNAGQNEIALIVDDGIFIILQAQSGKAVRKEIINGRATYTDIQPYQDGYLLVVNMSGYRDRYDKSQDGLSFWGKTDVGYWTTEFPRGAHLVVAGDRVLAITHRKGSRVVREISIPKAD